MQNLSSNFDWLDQNLHFNKILTETMSKSLLLVDKFRIDKYYVLKENV